MARVTVKWNSPLGGNRNTFYAGRAIYDTIGMAAWWIMQSIQDGKDESIRVYKNGRLVAREATIL